MVKVYIDYGGPTTSMVKVFLIHAGEEYKNRAYIRNCGCVRA